MRRKIWSLTLNDLNEKYRRFAEIVGIEKMIELCRIYGGTPFYFPTLKNLIKEAVYIEIVERYTNGENLRDLAVEYGISTSTIYKIIKDTLKEVSKI